MAPKRRNSRGMSGHQRPNEGESVEWLTPPEILRALGQFDLDPCCPREMPWKTATVQISPPLDGLTGEWHGRVFLNPPYGAAALGPWLNKLADHGNGIALVFARTETQAFHRHGWERASAMLFIEGRLYFHAGCDMTIQKDSPNPIHLSLGERAPFNGGAPSVLIAYGDDNANQLRDCGISGAFVRLGRVSQ